MNTTSRVIRCDLDRYSRVIFNLNNGIKKPYIYEIKATSYNKAGLLSLRYNSTDSKILLLNQLADIKEVIVDLNKYGRLILVCSSDDKSTYFTHYDKSVDYKFHFFTATWNTPRNVKSIFRKSKASDLLSRTVSKRKKVPTVKELQKDPLVIKKSKYRFKVKAFWTKQSDAARGKWSRLGRFNSIENSRSHFSLSYGYSVKHKMINYLLWKFALTPCDLQKWFNENRMTSSNIMTRFSSWILNRLPRVLVSSGFFGNYTLAMKSIKQGDILVNNVVVTEINYCVKVGDYISVSVSKVVQPTWRGVSNYFNDYIAPQYLLVDWRNRCILVKSNLTLSNYFVGDRLNEVSINTFRSKAVGSLKDPLLSLLWHFESYIRSLSR